MSNLLALWLPPLAATVILLAATRRAWRHHRRFKITLGLAMAFALLTLALPGLPAPLDTRLTPIFALCAVAFVGAIGEWRHAPDFGQRGLLWLAPRAAAPALLGAFGILVAQALWLSTAAPNVWQLPLLFTGSLACLLPCPRVLCFG